MVTKDDVLSVAALAKISLNEEEAESFRSDLDRVFNYFAQIQKISTENVEPLISPALDAVGTREDVVEKFTEMESVFKQAPEVVGRLFKVPPVI